MKLFNIFALLATWGLLSFAAGAADVDLKDSKFTWKGTKVTGEHFGEVSLQSAKVTTQDDKLTGGEFVIDLSSVKVSDLEGEWADKFITHIKGDDFFNIEKYPTAKLVIKSVKGNEFSGDLTIKGKTNPVKFTAKQSGKTYQGALKFNRTKFDMVYGSGSFFKGLGDKMIHDEVSLDFKVALK